MRRIVAVLVLVSAACGGGGGDGFGYPVPDGAQLVLDMDGTTQQWDVPQDPVEVERFYSERLDGWQVDEDPGAEDYEASTGESLIGLGFTATWAGGGMVVGAVDEGTRLVVTPDR